MSFLISGKKWKFLGQIWACRKLGGSPAGHHRKGQTKCVFELTPCMPTIDAAWKPPEQVFWLWMVIARFQGISDEALGPRGLEHHLWSWFYPYTAADRQTRLSPRRDRMLFIFTGRPRQLWSHLSFLLLPFLLSFIPSHTLFFRSHSSTFVNCLFWILFCVALFSTRVFDFSLNSTGYLVRSSLSFFPSFFPLSLAMFWLNPALCSSVLPSFCFLSPQNARFPKSNFWFGWLVWAQGSWPVNGKLSTKRNFRNGT